MEHSTALSLWELTCDTESHSVTAEVTVPAFAPALVLNFVTPEGRNAELILSVWLHTEMVYPPEDGHPSQY